MMALQVIFTANFLAGIAFLAGIVFHEVVLRNGEEVRGLPGVGATAEILTMSSKVEEVAGPGLQKAVGMTG